MAAVEQSSATRTPIGNDNLRKYHDTTSVYVLPNEYASVAFQKIPNAYTYSPVSSNKTASMPKQQPS